MLLIKKYGVWMALSLTLIASVWVGQQENDTLDAVVLVQQKNNASKATRGSMSSVTSPNPASGASVFRRPVIDDTPQNLFTVFALPQETSLDEMANSGPQLPANPFTYAGKLLDDGRLIVFLTDGVRNHSVQVGDVVDDVWQIQSIHPPELILKYIPLKTEIQMQIGASS